MTESSIEIIGGVDGPTAVWVTAGPADWVLPVLLLAAAALALWLWQRRNRKK